MRMHKGAWLSYDLYAGNQINLTWAMRPVVKVIEKSGLAYHFTNTSVLERYANHPSKITHDPHDMM